VYILIFEIFLRAFKGVGGRKFCGLGWWEGFFFFGVSALPGRNFGRERIVEGIWKRVFSWKR